MPCALYLPAHLLQSEVFNNVHVVVLVDAIRLEMLMAMLTPLLAAQIEAADVVVIWRRVTTPASFSPLPRFKARHASRANWRGPAPVVA